MNPSLKNKRLLSRKKQWQSLKKQPPLLVSFFGSTPTIQRAFIIKANKRAQG